jgi:hypothetical protein
VEFSSREISRLRLKIPLHVIRAGTKLFRELSTARQRSTACNAYQIGGRQAVAPLLRDLSIDRGRRSTKKLDHDGLHEAGYGPEKFE